MCFILRCQSVKKGLKRAGTQKQNWLPQKLLVLAQRCEELLQRQRPQQREASLRRRCGRCLKSRALRVAMVKMTALRGTWFWWIIACSKEIKFGKTRRLTMYNRYAGRLNIVQTSLMVIHDERRITWSSVWATQKDSSVAAASETRMLMKRRNTLVQ